jgi:hypothetical protein
MTAVVIVCLLSTQWNGALFASETPSSSSTVAGSSSETAASSDEQITSLEGMLETVIGGQAVETTNVSSALESQKGRPRVGFDALAFSNVLGTVTPLARRAFDVAPGRFDLFAGQVYQGPPYPYPYRHRRDGSIAAIMVGAAAAITGAAVLAYANRPECTADALAGGCGYGTKVVGTAVLSGGIVGLFVGALTWR